MTTEHTESVFTRTQRAISEGIAALEGGEEAATPPVEDVDDDKEDQVTPPDDADADDKQGEDEEDAAPVDTDEDEEEDEDEGEKPGAMVPRARLNRKTELLETTRRELNDTQHRAAVFEDRYNRLLSAIEEMNGGNQPAKKEEEDTFEPLDDEGYKRLNEKIDKKTQVLEEKYAVQSFSNAMQTEEVRMRAAHPDFDDAYQHYVNQVAASIGDAAEERGHKMSQTQLQKAASEHLAKTLFERHQSGLNIGDWVLRESKRFGYKPKEAAPPKEAAAPPKKSDGVDYDAVERNRAKTERKQPAKATPEAGKKMSDNDMREKYFKNGSFDFKSFKADTDRLIRASQ